MVTIPTPEQVGGQLATQAADQAQQMAAQAGGGILSTFKNILMSPLNALAGFGKNILSFSTVKLTALGTLALTGLRYLLPDLYGAGKGAVFGQESRQNEAGKTLLQVLADNATLAGGAAVAWNGASGAWNGVSETAAAAREEGSTLGGVASTFVGGATIVGIGLLGIGAAKHFMAGSSITPASTPPGTAVPPVKSPASVK